MMIINAIYETIFMVVFSGIITILLGLPLGILLYCLKSKLIVTNKILYYIFNLPTKFIYTTPYVIIMIVSIPIMKWLITHNIPKNIVTIIPLTFAAIPLFSMLALEALSDLPSELKETAKILGGSPLQTIFKIYLPEALPALIAKISSTLVQITNYSVIAGIFGSGGLGFIIMQKGYDTFELTYIAICTISLVFIIKVIQISCDIIAKQLLNQ